MVKKAVNKIEIVSVQQCLPYKQLQLLIACVNIKFDWYWEGIGWMIFDVESVEIFDHACDQ